MSGKAYPRSLFDRALESFKEQTFPLTKENSPISIEELEKRVLALEERFDRIDPGFSIVVVPSKEEVRRFGTPVSCAATTRSFHERSMDEAVSTAVAHLVPVYESLGQYIVDPLKPITKKSGE